MSQFFSSSESGAVFNEPRTHRYSLWRRWSGNCDASKMLPFIGLNPSTADESVNDQTVTRCINYAKSWGYHGMFMLNIFAFRATDPKDMKAFPDPIGDLNNQAILKIVGACGNKALCCWGAHGDFMMRGAEVKYLLCFKQLFHLGLTKSGHPKHPLYLKSNLKPTLWEPEN